MTARGQKKKVEALILCIDRDDDLGEKDKALQG